MDVQIVAKAHADGFETIDVVLYSVLTLEANSVLRRLDVIFTYYPLGVATHKAVGLFREFLLSSAVALDCLASLVVLLSSSLESKDLLYLAYIIMFYRYCKDLIWSIRAFVSGVFSNYRTSQTRQKNKRETSKEIPKTGTVNAGSDKKQKWKASKEIPKKGTVNAGSDKKLKAS